MGVILLGGTDISILDAGKSTLAAIAIAAVSLCLLGWFLPETLVSLADRKNMGVSL